MSAAQLRNEGLSIEKAPAHLWLIRRRPAGGLQAEERGGWQAGCRREHVNVSLVGAPLL